ncbi:Hsp20/alpha crystallin family protein, partial [Pricia sp.]|uniref:Hsp20/alpha crystallin family protein n=1 Tax=Pricia sp. TaxID=2268138 RepID=UPI003593C444
ERDRHWVRKEFVHNAFYRAFGLPKNVDTEKVDARMKDGLLTLKIGKKKGVDGSRTIIVK